MESGPTSSPSPPGSAEPRSGRSVPATAVLGVIAVVLIVVAVVAGVVWVVPVLTASSGPAQATGTPAASLIAGLPVESSGSSAAPSPSASAARPLPTTLPGGPFASSGSLVVVGADDSLSVVDSSGRSIQMAPGGAPLFLFPAWSPDGSKVAAVRSGASGSEIVVFDAVKAASGQAAEPIVIFRNPTIGPFYLSWTPDGRMVSFLASEGGDIALRVAPADGSAPLDGSGPGSTIRSGNPLYYDWIAADRLLAHVGSGTSAFLGEMTRDGTAAATAVKTPGEFRSPVVSHDRKFVGFIRATTTGGAEVVVTPRDGATERTMPVYGTAAMAFDPVGDTLASIGPDRPIATQLQIPVGPLRLLDAKTGAIRTLVDGSVVGFWWSPDGKTIATLRVQPIEGTSAPSPSAGATASGVVASVSPGSVPSASASAAPQSEVRLLFVDAASGRIQAQSVVEPGQLFIDQLLIYFDQYALSHHLWAPDSSSLLLPLVAADGSTRLAIMARNGDPPKMIDGVIGFWSP